MIVGERVVLRAFDISDIPLRVKWMNDPKVRRFLNAPFPVSEASTRKWLDRVVSDPSQEDYLICLRETGKPIGYSGFRGIDFLNLKAECYSGIGELECMGKGYASEARIIALHHIFNKYNLNKIYTKIRPENTAAIRLSERVGFKREGVAREDLFSHGAFRDMLILSILRREFLTLHPGVN